MLTKPQIVFIQERILSILGIQPPPVFYIGGSDTLPPPLEKEAEEKAVAALDVGCLSSIICVWWCTFQNALKTPA